MLQEFKKFAIKGNIFDMAVGIVIGAAFAPIVGSFVNDVLMPPIGMLLGGVDFSNLFFVLREGATAGPYETVAAAKEAGAVTVNYGLFVNTLINFLIIAWAVFMLVKGAANLKKKEEEAAPAAPPKPSEEVVLLREIRDSLKKS